VIAFIADVGTQRLGVEDCPPAVTPEPSQWLVGHVSDDLLRVDLLETGMHKALPAQSPVFTPRMKCPTADHRIGATGSFPQVHGREVPLSVLTIGTMTGKQAQIIISERLHCWFGKSGGLLLEHPVFGTAPESDPAQHHELQLPTTSSIT